ncbi:MAG: response regulator [Crocinitomicaceae bacterium]
MQKILIIEDETDIRETIVDTLEFAKYNVQSAPNGAEGIEKAQTFQPDLILCDVMMSGISGYEVLKELRQKPTTFEISFIFLTAKVAKEDRRKGMAMGADDYLAKPFTSSEVIEAVQTRLDRHTRLKKYNSQQMQSLREYINRTLPHELRTPLTGILGYLYLLEDSVQDMDMSTIQSMLGTIKNSSERLGALVENFISFSQLQVTRSNSELREKLRNSDNFQNFELIIHESIEKEAYRFKRMEDVQIRVEAAPVRIFRDHAGKLIRAIVSNAFKFSAQGTAIEIIGQVVGDSYLLTIANQGRGMSHEQIDNIQAQTQFEREEYEQQGAGMGLATAQIVLEIYEGEMIIESEQGAKTSVLIRLPLA